MQIKQIKNMSWKEQLSDVCFVLSVICSIISNAAIQTGLEAPATCSEWIINAGN